MNVAKVVAYLAVACAVVGIGIGVATTPATAMLLAASVVLGGIAAVIRFVRWVRS